MATAHHPTIEAHRQREQARLDGLKSAAERKVGQFATPFELALSLTQYVHQLRQEGAIRLLDRAIGSGSFFSALSQTVPKAIEAATGFEMGPFFADAAEKLWGKSGLHITRGDFTKQKPPRQRCNLVLTNPPYVRHHHLDGAEKDRLKA